jgi:succinate dehydrogenase flavin-adding protein (antitoxin of CptAB toxin-antitoxin module)
LLIFYRAKCKHLEKHNIDKFMRFIYMGKALIDYCTEGDVENFKRLFIESDDKELMYWHMQKCFKAALRAKQLKMIEFMIEDLDMPLNHEAFDGTLNTFIWMC